MKFFDPRFKNDSFVEAQFVNLFDHFLAKILYHTFPLLVERFFTCNYGETFIFETRAPVSLAPIFFVFLSLTYHFFHKFCFTYQNFHRKVPITLKLLNIALQYFRYNSTTLLAIFFVEVNSEKNDLLSYSSGSFFWKSRNTCLDV